MNPERDPKARAVVGTIGVATANATAAFMAPRLTTVSDRARTRRQLMLHNRHEADHQRMLAVKLTCDHGHQIAMA